jgi:mono/diheme cytochrome c family protein
MRIALRFLAPVAAWWMAIGTASADDPADREFFEAKVRPVLANNCFSCHSEQGGKRKGGLTLDSRDGLMRGGLGGAAVVPGTPEESLLIEAVRYESPDLQMPPKGKLPPEAVADLETWVRGGAHWPVEAGAPKSGGNHYAFDLEKTQE